MRPCPVCETPSRAPFLVRESVPVHQNLLCDSVEAARALNRGRLELHACEYCGFVFNAAFDASLLNYGAAYDNTQSCSPVFEAYLERLADQVVNDRGVRGKRIVEIGCGKGGFLRALVLRDAGNRGVGFDPSYVGPETDLDGRLRFERRFYDASCAGLGAEAIVCRHVIEHVPTPIALLRLVRQTVTDGTARVFFETPAVEWILERDVIWDFFYEHCSYFGDSSIEYAFRRAGFEVEGNQRSFGGQYLWIEARAGSEVGADAVDVPARAGHVAGLAQRFAAREAELVVERRERLEQFAADGAVAIWGAGAKGVTLANLIDPDRRLVSCVVDLNPNKQGHYLPGTGHPIVAPDRLPGLGVRTAVLTNPEYVAENVQLLRNAAIDVRLVDFMQQDRNALSH